VQESEIPRLSTESTRVLVSFDIDGTLEVGDPPGPITLDTVRRAKAMGYVIGSCSDRTHREQRELWKRHDIEVDFVSLKHELSAIRVDGECVRNVHVGDSTVDQHYAGIAGFEFWFVHELPASDGWLFVSG
jgi:predicted mannosyl-3-phosphoglycerate phosphatase (HAD superfamily)